MVSCLADGVGSSISVELKTSVDSVMSNSDLVSKIITKSEIATSMALIRCSIFNNAWLSASRSLIVQRWFSSTKTPAHLGFLVQFRKPGTRTGVFRLIYARGNQTEVSSNALRPLLNSELWEGADILSSADGVVLGLKAGSMCGDSDVYYTFCPSARKNSFSSLEMEHIVQIPRNGGQHTDNTFGQFGLILGRGWSGLPFFEKDAATLFNSDYNGVSFNSTDPVFVHVCIHKDGGWSRTVSSPIQSPVVPVFHRNPYGVLSGGKLYMMYVVGYIVCLDILTSQTCIIELSDEMGFNVNSWNDYTVAPKCGGGVVFIKFSNGDLERWVLHHEGNHTVWSLESKVDLVQKIGSRISDDCWEEVFNNEGKSGFANYYYKIQMRKASSNGRFVLLSTGFDPGLFEVDMDMKTVTEIQMSSNESQVGRIYSLSEEWPPKVYFKGGF